MACQRPFGSLYWSSHIDPPHPPHTHAPLEQILQNIFIAAAVVLVITILLLANFRAAGAVFLMVVAVDVNVLGFLYFWGLDFNSVTAVNLVIAVGLAVDPNVHICHAFLNAQGDTRNQRATVALEELGLSVFNGAMSTTLAILPLAFGKSYIFTVCQHCIRVRVSTSALSEDNLRGGSATFPDRRTSILLDFFQVPVHDSPVFGLLWSDCTARDPVSRG